MYLDTVDVQIDGAFAHVTLNRPDAKNAINRQLTADVITAFETLRDNHAIRAIVLSGAGGTFCAGGDLKEMRQAFSPDAKPDTSFERVLTLINQAPQIVIAKIEGAAMGGGFGMICVSDIAIASETAMMGLPEVRLGIAPAFISPYVIDRIGMTRARELFLTGRRFNGTVAHEYGLVHEVVAPDALDARVDDLLNDLQNCAPNAIREIKSLIFAVNGKPYADTVDYRANLLHTLRTGEEAHEGVAAFLGKRKPKWAQTDGDTE